MNVLIYLAVATVLYLLWLWLAGRGLEKLSCIRSFSKPAVFEGEEGEMIEIVRNDGPAIIPWLRLESKISPHLRLGTQENLDVNWQMHYCSVFALMPYQQIRRTHKVTFLRRGLYDLGNASLTTGDLLGIYPRHLKQDLTARVTVYPRLLGEEHLPSLNSLLMGSLSNRMELTSDPFLVRGIRPYLPGDPVRDIHWPATVCVRALQDGLCAGFATNLPIKDTKSPTVMLPQEGPDQIEELLTAFAQLDTLRSQHFVTLLESLQTLSGTDILVLSRYDSESIQQQLTQLRRYG